MLRRRNYQNDVERGGQEVLGVQVDEVTNNQNDSDSIRSPKESDEQPQKIDDSANDLWSLYGRKVKGYDETQMKALKDDMDGLLVFAGLFSAVITTFVVPQIQNLQVNPADQSVYYQNQSVQMLDRISQQLASVGSQAPTSFIPPPYPTFHPSASDRRVNIFWLVSLVCSLFGALLAALVRQWARDYLRISQRSGNPLKTARIRLFLFEGAERLPAVAEAVPGLLHLSLMLFFWGLCDTILQTDTVVFVAIVVPIGGGVFLYLYCAIAPIRDPQSPYRTPLSGLIWNLFKALHRSSYYNYFREVVRPASMETRREHSAMKMTKGRMDRDVRAVRWLVDNINGTDETETFVLAIPGSFDQDWGRNVWQGVMSEDQLTSIVDPQIQSRPVLPSLREGTAFFSLCRSVRYHLNIYSKEEGVKDAKEQHRRLCVCIEAVACLVCCTGVELGLFGEVGEVLGALGDKERTNDPLTIKSNPLFCVRWTCLSLVAIGKTVDGDRVQELAKFSIDGIARLQPDYDRMPLTAARRIDNYLKRAWWLVQNLYQAFEPWQYRTEYEIREILNSHAVLISELERIEIEAVGVEDVDWRIPLLQDAMDEATRNLTRCLPGVFFSKMKLATPIMIRENFDLSSVETTGTLVPPQFIFPGQQIQSLCDLGQRLRDIIEERNLEQNTERLYETLNNLESLSVIPVALRKLKYPMKRQLWRLLDLRDGGGLGFTIELFFLALRQLSSASLSDELKKDFFTGTFKVITANWEKSKGSAGTQGILLDLLCDLVIRGRGLFSDFFYPPYIVDMLLDLVGKMVKGHGDEPHIDEAIQELEDFDLWNRMDGRLRLRVKALSTIGTSSDTASL